ARVPRGAKPIAGHAYLLRSVRPHEADVVVALHVVDVDADHCTIAWRIVESRPVEEPRDPWVPIALAESLPPASEALAAMNEVELRAALDAVRARAEQVILDRFDPAIEARDGTWRTTTDRGIVRLTPYLTQWSELMPGFLGGSAYSFDERRHDAR